MKILPNILSIFRICLVPVFVAAYMLDTNDVKLYAVIVYVTANLSDVLDGFIARKFDAQSHLGKFLDPIGDKLITFAAIVCLTISRPVLIWAVCIFFVKEICMGIGGLLIHKKAKLEIPPASIIGKVSTTIFFLSCFTLLLFSNIPDNIAVVIMSVAIGITLIAFVHYLLKYVRIMKSQKEKLGTGDS